MIATGVAVILRIWSRILGTVDCKKGSVPLPEVPYFLLTFAYISAYALWTAPINNLYTEIQDHGDETDRSINKIYARPPPP